MPPRSTTDCDEPTMASEGCGSASCEVKDLALSPTENNSSRCVRFAPTAKVRQIAKFTKEQAKEVWFVNEELASMKRSFAPTVQRMMSGLLTEQDEMGEEHCTRGLEYRTKAGARRRMKNKFNGIASVLHEQDRQNFEEKPDPELLAQVYSEATAHCMREAMATGLQDELAVKEYVSTSNEPIYLADERIPVRSPIPVRVAGIKATGSFHERSIQSIKRVFSGKMRRRSQSTTRALGLSEASIS